MFSRASTYQNKVIADSRKKASYKRTYYGRRQKNPVKRQDVQMIDATSTTEPEDGVSDDLRAGIFKRALKE